MGDDRRAEHEHWLREEFRSLTRAQVLFVSGYLASAVPWDLENALAAAKQSPYCQDVVDGRPLHIVQQHRSEME